MILQQMIEEIEIMFTKIPRTKIKNDINNAYFDFCSETRILDYDVDLTITNAVIYTLPSDLNILERVVYYNSAGKQLGDVLSWTISKGKLYFSDSNGGQLTTFPSEITRVQLLGVKKPTVLTADANATEIPRQFDDAIIYKVLSDYYKKYPTLQRILPDNSILLVPDINLSQMYKNGYDESVFKAKKYASSNRSVSKGKIKFYRY